MTLAELQYRLFVNNGSSLITFENEDFSMQSYRDINFQGSIFNDCNFYRSDIRESHFSRCIFHNSYLSNCDMRDSIFEESQIIGGVFSGDMAGIQLRGIKFTNVTHSGSKIYSNGGINYYVVGTGNYVIIYNNEKSKTVSIERAREIWNGGEEL